MIQEPTAKPKPLYFQDPGTDLIFVLTLCKHAFEGSEIAECYSAAVRVFTPEDGSNYRQIDNVGLKHRTTFDWLDAVLK